MTAAAAAMAHPNIALVKYWGKRDESLHLPVTSSLSVTLNIFPTTTTVTVSGKLAADVVTLGGEPAPVGFAGKVAAFLDLVREVAGDRRRALVATVNTAPTGAGLASSSAGFAALAVAATAAYGVDLDPRALSRLARRGSGSAARSIFGGFVAWWRGGGVGAAGDYSSYADPIVAPDLDAAVVVAVVDAREKAVSSREAMRHTVETSPFYRSWAESSERDFRDMLAAVATGDLRAVGEISERNALGMHATMLGARPPLRYLVAGSMQVLDRVAQLRAEGLAGYATIDAGPNVKVLCHRADSASVAAVIADLSDVLTVHVATPGPGAVRVDPAVPGRSLP
jgi:diphosphomevalonate decarboxylase